MQFPLLLAAGGYEAPEIFLSRISGFLGGYYIAVALMNAVAAYYLWHFKHRSTQALVWTVTAVLFTTLAPLAGSGNPAWTPSLPAWAIEASNALLSGSRGAVIYSVGTVLVLAVLFVGRKFFTQPQVAWTGLNLSLLLMGLAMTNQSFWSIISKGDNIPIVGLVYLLGFFTWLATRRAVINDERIAQGLPPLEKLDDQKVLVWPDLVYTELICMVALTALLLVWGIAIEAPLEEPASRVKTPNPSKAPWYFLGLQEMLVYFDPWMAGVVAPSLIIVGLMALPYIDFNKKGTGYYTINERKFAYITFQFGFLVLWVTLIIMGTFLRGPNWNFFGPFEQWDPHKLEAQDNVMLSELFWEDALNRSRPKPAADASFLTTAGTILLRESPGIVLLLGYFVFVPPLLAVWTRMFREMYLRMGFIRYMLMTNLLMFMVILPIKMALRWTMNLKYLVNIDEWFLNF